MQDTDLFSKDEWIEALETAENNSFDPVDSREEGGDLAAWLCDLHTHDKVNQEEAVLEAVIRVIHNHRQGDIAPVEYLSVLNSYQGETSYSFRHEAEEHMEEKYGFYLPFPGDPSDEDFEKWYVRYCRSENEVYAEVSSGESIHWFDKSKW